MTTQGLEVTAGTAQDMPRVWPGALKAVWPAGAPVSDTRYEAFALGRDLQVREPSVSLRPWKPATELPASELTGDLVKLPTACGKHFAQYPTVLVTEAMHGRFYAFVVSCDCGLAYMIHTEPDGAHCKAAGDPTGIAELYDRVPGDEETLTNRSITFRCKRLK